MRRLLPLLVLAGCGTRHILTKEHGAAEGSAVASAALTDAGVPDAEPPPTIIADAAPPATITFDRATWQPGDVVKITRRVSLKDSKGAEATDAWDLTLKVASVTGGDVVADAGPDCIVRFTGGTVKITGTCQGNDTDVAYKLDLVAQLLAVPRGTVTAGDRADGFARPLIALWHLQEAGAIVTARLTAADPTGATYAVHAELDGLMLKQGLHVTASLDGPLRVDVHATAITATISSPRATFTGWPLDDYRGKGTLTLELSITR